ncbi:response regulator [Echinicola sp. CAU 1574]|uniref:Response regulator n=1 Tax=Echinicola arenosa TaxID=2774144 RepID=A0ABR9AMU3_9BACT|nr:response regulator [Echinicola arenosa]MBD8489215.1 response regulator [Echinicola arenosa]
MVNEINILLVEDDPFIGDMIKSDLLKTFSQGQVNVTGPATSFQEGAELLNSDTFDIALLDIDLNGDQTAGIQLALLINQISSIPVVFLSGLPKNTGFDIAKLTMPYAFLRKPYRRQELEDLMELLVIKQSQSKKENHNQSNHRSKSSNNIRPTIFVTTGHGELTGLPIKELVLLEADDKVIKAYFLNKEQPIVFSSPGLKNFYDENHHMLGKSFFQLSRKYVIDLKKIISIKNNHVHLPKYSKTPSYPLYFSLPIPQNGEKRKLLFDKLGIEGK